MKFSIIIPAYNAEKCIERCLNSVLNQGFNDYEAIVINDGSTDNTLSKLEAYNTPKIRLFSQNNKGISGARNKGIIEARGDYICFLDADDEYCDNHLSVLDDMIGCFPNEHFFVTGYRIVLLNGDTKDISIPKEYGRYYYSDNFFELTNQHGSFFHVNSFCIHRSVFNNVGYFEYGVSPGEDTDMWYRIGIRYPIVVSPIITTKRHRDYSIATKKRAYEYDWCFEKRINDILKDDSIPTQRIDSLMEDIENRKMSKIRHKILDGKKIEAMRKLGDINFKMIGNHKIVSTFFSLLIPSFFLRKILDFRDRDYYSK